MLKAARDDLVPLEEFLYQSPAEFMSNPVLHYAQAWGLIHFLLHGAPEHEELFRELVRELKESDDAQATVRRVFEDQDLRELERSFRRHVAELRSR